MSGHSFSLTIIPEKINHYRVNKQECKNKDNTLRLLMLMQSDKLIIQR